MYFSFFASVFRNPNNQHLQNFFWLFPLCMVNIILDPLPPRTYLCICLGFAYRLNYVEYIMMNAEDKINKKNKQEASFTDDGFSR